MSDSKQLLDNSPIASTIGTGVPASRRGALTAGSVAEAHSPWLTGRMRGATGSYYSSCLLLVGVALLGAIATLGLPERRKTA